MVAQVTYSKGAKKNIRVTGHEGEMVPTYRSRVAKVDYYPKYNYTEEQNRAASTRATSVPRTRRYQLRADLTQY